MKRRISPFAWSLAGACTATLALVFAAFGSVPRFVPLPGVAGPEVKAEAAVRVPADKASTSRAQLHVPPESLSAAVPVSAVVAGKAASAEAAPAEAEALSPAAGVLTSQPSEPAKRMAEIAEVSAISDAAISTRPFELAAARDETAENAADQSAASPSAQTATVQNVLQSLGFIPGAPGSSNAARPKDLPTARVNEMYCATLGRTLGAPNATLKLKSGFTPKGLFLNTSTGALCGRPAESGIFYFTVEQQDGALSTDQFAYRLVVSDETAGETEGTLTLSSTQLPVGVIGAEYSFQLEARGGTAPYSWTATGLPDGIELDAETGLLGGSPARDGEFAVSLTVRDGTGAGAHAQLPLVVRTTPVFITTTNLGEGTVGELFQARLAAQGGSPPYRWEAISPLPAGLSLSASSGVIEGSPSEAFERTLAVQVFDSAKKSDTADLAMTIHSSPVRILTAHLTDGFTGTPYSLQLSADGGQPPYSWSESRGAIPSGLTLSPEGLLAGTPRANGEFLLGLVVFDSLGQTASRSVQLRLQRLAPTPTPVPAESTPVPTHPPDGSDGSIGGVAPTPTATPVFAAPTGLVGIASDAKAGIVWDAPPGALNAEFVLVRSTGAAVSSPENGTPITTGASNHILDVGLENDVAYSYTAFLRSRSDGSLSAPASVSVTPRTLGLTAKPDPFADGVTNFQPLDPQCYNCSAMPELVLGGPHGGGETNGSSRVVSLGAKVNSDGGRSAPYGGSITLEFRDNIIVNGAGPDFTIFENAFRLAGTDNYFVEPAVVEVSADGTHFYRFPFTFVPHYNSDGSLNLYNPFCYARGFAGVHPVYSNGNSPSPLNSVLSGGDQFDLSDLPGNPLSWARFVRITATGDGWLLDDRGTLVRHSNSSPFFGASGKGNSGFDLDAITAINF